MLVSPGSCGVGAALRVGRLLLLLPVVLLLLTRSVVTDMLLLLLLLMLLLHPLLHPTRTHAARAT